MAAQGFEQRPCPQCGSTVWISPAVGVGLCPSCHTQVGLHGGVSTASSSFPVGKLIGIVLGALLIGGLSIGGYYLKTKFFGPGGKDSAGYGALGIDPENAEPAELMRAATDVAHAKWHYRSVWWDAKFHGVRADGTIDITSDDGSATLTFVKPLEITFRDKNKRKDSVRRFSFQPKGLKFDKPESFLEFIPKDHPMPKAPCDVGDLVRGLKLEGSETVRVTFDPLDAGDKVRADGRSAWRVMNDSQSVDAYYDLYSCELLEDRTKRP